MAKEDKWIHDAFNDIQKEKDTREFEAYKERLVGQLDSIYTRAGYAVGLERMEKMSGVVLKSGTANTLADFIRFITTAAFSIGYNAGLEAGA